MVSLHPKSGEVKMTPKLMQYDPERDDKVTRLTINEAIDSPVMRQLCGGEDPLVSYLRAGHAQRYASQKDAPTELTVTRNADYSKKDKIDLYNALRAMEIRNPSVSRIRSEVEFISDKVGTVVARDFRTNQPVFYEMRAVQDSNPTVKEYPDRKLGPEIVEPDAPILRALFIDPARLLGRDYMDTSAGRLVGVVPERR